MFTLSSWSDGPGVMSIGMRQGMSGITKQPGKPQQRMTRNRWIAKILCLFCIPLVPQENPKVCYTPLADICFMQQ